MSNSGNRNLVKPNKDHMRRFLEIMLRPEVGCMELCGLGAIIDYRSKMVIKANKSSMVISGWYDNVEDIMRDAARFQETSIYITVNPVSRDLLAKSYCKLSRPEHRTKDDQIICYEWLYIDIDPIRDSDISSTDRQLALAIEKRDEILTAYPFIRNSSIWGRSGNGCWILVRVGSLSVSQENTDDMKLLLENISNKHSTTKIDIDKTCKNPSRLMCLIGSVKCKGDSVSDRPHRVSTLDSEEVPTETVNIKEWLKLFPIQEKIAAKVDPNPKKNIDEYKRIRRIKYFEKTINDEINDLLFEKDKRNVQLNDSAGRLYRFVQPGGLTREEVDRELWAACIQIGLDQDTNSDVQRTLDSAWDYSRTILADLSTIRELNPDREYEKKIEDADFIPDDPPEIIIGFDSHRITKECIVALRKDPNLYQRFGELVSIKNIPMKDPGCTKEYNVHKIYKVDSNNVFDRLTQYAKFKKYEQNDAKDWILVDTLPHHSVAEKVISNNEWSGIRSLSGIVATPVLRSDGTILDSKGYDRETWLMFRTDQEFPEINEFPTYNEAVESRDMLFDLLDNFPFSKNPSQAVHKASWLAALLTPLARHAIDGPCPLFMFDGNTRGVGKSLLCDLISIIVNGSEMPRTPYTSDEEEQRKEITSAAIAGYSMSLVDNVPSVFGGPSIDALLTGKKWRDRILGVSQNTDDIPLTTVWYVTGNNITFKNDSARRIVLCRLETTDEHPEKRDIGKFKHKLIKDYTLSNYKMLAKCALTILRAYFTAGCPDQNLESLGSYDAWTRVVRSAVHWVTDVDPCSSSVDFGERDVQSSQQAALLEGWLELPNHECGLTCSQVLKLVKDESNRYRREKYKFDQEFPGGGMYVHEPAEPEYQTLRDALMEWSNNSELPNTRVLGNRLRTMRGKVYDSRKLFSRVSHNTHVWYIIDACKSSPDDGFLRRDSASPKDPSLTDDYSQPF